MRKDEIVDIVERTLEFLERSGADLLAQQYLSFALATFAKGCKEQLAHYILRYDVQVAQPPNSARLVLNDNANVSFTLDPYANLIGRVDPQTRSYPNIDLTKYDLQAKISRRHARIYSLDGRNFWLEDLDSFNGTTLNGVRIQPRQPLPIHEGDEITFGGTSFSYVETD
ncbi:MAG: FHA domain-containing protein [Acidobacteriota bacterium]|nr:FHA domain-containing protein [Blastocatellia bacterium]MDW8413137.1 FHA domain-containing protein [Acidobacteriota bacterium]